jgi:hypothetical protein
MPNNMLPFLINDSNIYQSILSSHEWTDWYFGVWGRWCRVSRIENPAASDHTCSIITMLCVWRILTITWANWMIVVVNMCLIWKLFDRLLMWRYFGFWVCRRHWWCTLISHSNNEWTFINAIFNKSHNKLE